MFVRRGRCYIVTSHTTDKEWRAELLSQNLADACYLLITFFCVANSTKTSVHAGHHCSRMIHHLYRTIDTFPFPALPTDVNERRFFIISVLYIKISRLAIHLPASKPYHNFIILLSYNLSLSPSIFLATEDHLVIVYRYQVSGCVPSLSR